MAIHCRAAKNSLRGTLSFCDRSVDRFSHPLWPFIWSLFSSFCYSSRPCRKQRGKSRAKGRTAYYIFIYISFPPQPAGSCTANSWVYPQHRNGERSDWTDNVIGKAATGRNVNIQYFCRLDSSIRLGELQLVLCWLLKKYKKISARFFYFQFKFAPLVLPYLQYINIGKNT